MVRTIIPHAIYKIALRVDVSKNTKSKLLTQCKKVEREVGERGGGGERMCI